MRKFVALMKQAFKSGLILLPPPSSSPLYMDPKDWSFTQEIYEHERRSQYIALSSTTSPIDLRGNHPIACSGKPNTSLVCATHLIVDDVGSCVIGGPNQPSRLARSAGAAETGDVISVGVTGLSDSLWCASLGVLAQSTNWRSWN